MARTNKTQETEASRSVLDRSRRTVLKLAGTGAGIATLGGASVLGAAQEEDEETPDGTETTDGTETETETAEETADDTALVDDLIDPTFGYPLAADETGSVTIDTVVEMGQLPDGGVHENFPQSPEPDGGEFPIEFIFDPVGVQIRPGQVVHFLSVAGEHTATAFDEKYANPELSIPTRIPEGATGFTSPPVIGGESWLYQFDEPGVYDILCLPHYPLGMVMRIVVFDPEEDSIEDDAVSIEPAEAVPPNVGTVLNAAELAPANIVEAGTVAWADLSLGAEATATPEETATETETETTTEAGTETETETTTEAGTETEQAS